MVDFIIEPNAQRIAIPYSKQKTVLLLLGAITFVALGLWFITHPAVFQDDYRHRPKIEIVIIGCLSVGFFGMCAIGMVITLFTNKPSLVIDDKGLSISRLLGTPRLVSWFDIKSFDISAYRNVAFIAIQLKDTGKFMQAQKSVINRKLMSFNVRQTGAPLNISTNNLKCDFNQLYDLLCERLKEFKAAEKETHYKADV